MVSFEAFQIKMRGDHGLVNAKAVQIGLGVDACGRKEVLGMLIAESETAFMKLLHLAVKKVTQKCKRSSPFWKAALRELAIQFDDRLVPFVDE